MKAIYKGKCHFVVARESDAVWIEQLFRANDWSHRMQVRLHDPDLILDPTDEDLDLAEAFERGEINAFEYADGHTFPPGRAKSNADSEGSTFVDSSAIERRNVRHADEVAQDGL